MIFQLLDDHSRCAVASHVADSETRRLRQGDGRPRVPQRLLSDNGLAFSPPRRGFLGQPVEPFLVQAAAKRLRPLQVPRDLPAGTTVKKLTSTGTFMLNKVHYKVDGRYRFHDVSVIVEGDQITMADLEGEILIEHTRPGPGVTYVGNGRPQGGRAQAQIR